MIVVKWNSIRSNVYSTWRAYSYSYPTRLKIEFYDAFIILSI